MTSLFGLVRSSMKGAEITRLLRLSNDFGSRTSKNSTWYWISPGAIVAIFLWIVFTSGFRLYLQYFNTYNRTYGSLGAVIILMLWMYLTGMAILLGGVINSVLTEMSSAEIPAAPNDSQTA